MVTAVPLLRAHRRTRADAVRSVGVDGLVRILPLVVVVLLVADYVVAVVRPATRVQVWLWTTATGAFPIWFVGALMFVAVTATVLVGAMSVVRPARIDALLVIEMGLYYFGTKIWPPTGDQIGWWQNSASRNVAMSEPLADIAHKIPYWFTGTLESVRYVSPVFGVLTITVYLLLARRLSNVFGTPSWVFRMFVIASPLPFWYVTGYIENTFLALPFMLLGIERTLAHLGSPSRVRLAAAAASFAAAALFHAGFALMCFAFAAALLLRPATTWRRRASELGFSFAVVLVAVLLVLGVTRLLPVDLVPGNTRGGYDDDLFVPTVLTAGDPLAHFTFFSHAHLIQVANIVVHAAPAVVLAIPVIAFTALRLRNLWPVLLDAPEPRRQALTVLGCVSLAYLAFVSVWGFDLGSVGDLDLMLVMGAGLGLYAVAVAASLLQGRTAVLAALLVTSGGIDIAFYSMKVANAWVQ